MENQSAREKEVMPLKMGPEKYAKMTAELDKILMKELKITSRAERRKSKMLKIINL